MRIAAAAWRLRSIASPNEFESHVGEFFLSARAEGADWLVLPELPVLELLALRADLDLPSTAHYMADFADPYEALLKRLVYETGVRVIGGSHLRREGNAIFNVAIVVDGEDVRYQPKNMLTGFEVAPWGLEARQGLVRNRDARIGVLVCYDSEFPESGRALAESGVTVLAVPSFTETRHGFQRVRWSCLARAVENQVFVIHASLVGDLGREPVPSTAGTSAVLTPSHSPFPESAVLAETVPGVEGLAVADLDFAALAECRATGDVRNWDDRSKSAWQILD